MKYNFILISFFLSFLFAGENTTSIKVDGMQCSYSCAGKVQSVVQKIDGVKESSVDFAKGMATITFDEDKVNRTEIIKYLKNNTSYKIEQASAYQKSGGCGGSKKRDTQI
ncbi:cation transporter [Candidatus Marinimicrobia bacterium]|nr:cation transporter [Candidatus Neomarinimicrobiota bacterium]